MTLSGSDIYGIVATIALVGGGALTLKSRIPQQTIINLKELSESQAALIADLQKGRVEDVKAIADLQGQIKVYKELPLQDMAAAMQDISRVNRSIADSNTKILAILNKSADALAANVEATKRQSDALINAVKDNGA